MMKNIFVLVEGDTEYLFVESILKDEFIKSDIFIKPIIVETSRERAGKKHSGGGSSFKHIERHLIRLFNDSSVDLFTTMLDFYKLPSDCPGKKEVAPTDCYKKVEIIENKLYDHFNNRKFFPYIQLHEFETLLFSDIDKINEHFFEYPKIKELKRIVKKSPNPEEINDNKNTAPSKRLKKIFPNYGKTSDGIIIIKKIGLDKIRKECRHFDNWIRKLHE